MGKDAGGEGKAGRVGPLAEPQAEAIRYGEQLEQLGTGGERGGCGQTLRNFRQPMSSSSVPQFWEPKSTPLRVAQVEKHRPVRETLKDTERKNTPRRGRTPWRAFG